MEIPGLAMITPNGIVFQGKVYTCSLAIKEQWFCQNYRGEKRLSIRYRPEDISYIILDRSSGEEFGRVVDTVLFMGSSLTDYQEALKSLMLERKNLCIKKPTIRIK